MLACTKNSGRQVSWLAGRRPHRPSQSKPVAVERGLAAYNCGGSHSSAVFPVRPVRAPTNRGIMPVFAADKAHRHQAGRALAALSRLRVDAAYSVNGSTNESSEDRRMTPWLTVVGIG